MLNNGASPAEILVIELKDTYALNQLRVPWSERDPVNQDPGHFKPVLEDTHARVLLMLLNPREGTVESQFADRLEIALTPRHESVTDVDGKSHEVRKDAGSYTTCLVNRPAVSDSSARACFSRLRSRPSDS